MKPYYLNSTLQMESPEMEWLQGQDAGSCAVWEWLKGDCQKRSTAVIRELSTLEREMIARRLGLTVDRFKAILGRMREIGWIEDAKDTPKFPKAFGKLAGWKMMQEGSYNSEYHCIRQQMYYWKRKAENQQLTQKPYKTLHSLTKTLQPSEQTEVQGNHALISNDLAQNLTKPYSDLTKPYNDENDGKASLQHNELSQNLTKPDETKALNSLPLSPSLPPVLPSPHTPLLSYPPSHPVTPTHNVGGTAREAARKDRGTPDEVATYCLGLGLEADDAGWFFDKMIASGWKNGGQPVKDWRATIRVWKRMDLFPSQKGAVTAGIPRNGVQVARKGPPAFVVIKALEDAIAKHPANSESRYSVDNPTDEQREALRTLKKRLAELKAQEGGI